MAGMKAYHFDPTWLLCEAAFRLYRWSDERWPNGYDENDNPIHPLHRIVDTIAGWFYDAGTWVLNTKVYNRWRPATPMKPDFEGFARAILEHQLEYGWMDGIEGEDLEELARCHGIVRRVAYNPELHGESWLVDHLEPGDDWWVPWYSGEEGRRKG